MLNLNAKPKMGLLLLASELFRATGEGSKRGAYPQRKQFEAEQMLNDCKVIADVSFPGVISTADDIRRAIDVFTADKVDYVLAVYLSWAEDFHWARFLRDMPPCPVLFMNLVHESIELGDTFIDDEFTACLGYGGLVGALEASGTATRFNRPMLVRGTGTWVEILERAKCFGRAARARALLKNAKFGLLASFNELMWSTYVDPFSVFSQLGPELHFLPFSELARYVDEVSDEDATATMHILKEKYEVMDDVKDYKLLASVRASIGMERMAEAHDLDLLILNDIDNEMCRLIGLRPGFWPTPSCKGTFIVPEGDVGGGIACYLLKLLGDGHVNYIEPFHIDKPTDTFEAGHAGPNDYTDPRGKCKIATDVFLSNTPWKYSGAPFGWYTFPTGEKTMLHCSQQDGKFQLLTSIIESLPTDHRLATFSHGRFRPIGQSCAQLFNKLVSVGVTQHFGIVDGDCRNALEDFAAIMGFHHARL